MEEKEGNEHWDIVVYGNKHKSSFNFQELWKYRDLILQFAKRDLTTVYNQTILGPLWYLIQPVLTTLLFLLVFGNIAKISTGAIPGILFYLSGLCMWNYFSASFNSTSSTFVANAAIFGKVYFPRLVTPLSKILSGLFVFAIQFLLFLVAYLYFIFFKGLSVQISAYMLLVPLLIVIMGGFALGFGIIISSLTTKYRDLTYLVTFGVQLLMYLTPVIYPLSFVTGKKRLFLLINPLTSVIDSFHYAFFPSGQFNWNHLAYSAFSMIVILLVGILLFNKIERNFLDTV